MIYATATPDEYIALLPEDRKQAIQMLRRTIKENLPAGFEEIIQYGIMSAKSVAQASYISALRVFRRIRAPKSQMADYTKIALRFWHNRLCCSP